jgi:hypothetical protein
VHKQLQSYTANNNKVREDFQIKEFTLDSFAMMAHGDRAENIQAVTWPAPPSSAIIGSMIMSLLFALPYNLTNMLLFRPEG